MQADILSMFDKCICDICSEGTMLSTCKHYGLCVGEIYISIVVGRGFCDDMSIPNVPYYKLEDYRYVSFRIYKDNCETGIFVKK